MYFKCYNHKTKNTQTDESTKNPSVHFVLTFSLDEFSALVCVSHMVQVKEYINDVSEIPFFFVGCPLGSLSSTSTG